jgi:hypothetical protein
MTVYTWVRSWTTVAALANQSAKMAVVPRGSVLRRVHYGWSMMGTTSTLYSAPDIMDTVIGVGVITGFPDTSYVPPNPLVTPGDPAPPTNRWIWWENRWLRPRTWGAHDDDVVTWEDTGPIESTDTHSLVLANTPAGQNLGVFLSWGTTRTDFTAAGYARVSAWWSILYST